MTHTRGVALRGSENSSSTGPTAVRRRKQVGNDLQKRGTVGTVQRIGFDRLPEPISRIQTLVDRIKELKEQAFIVCPFTSLDLVPANFQISERVITLDTNPKNGDVYTSSFTKGDDVALAKNGILKIWAAAGGTVLSSKQVDDRSDPLFVEWSVMLEIRQIDGNVVQYPGSKRLDLRDGSPEILAMKSQAGMIATARQFIVSMAESKALLRGMRGVLALNQSYSAAELRTKPFVCYTLVPIFDTTDPVIRRMVAASLLGPGLYAQVVKDMAAESQTGETRVITDGARLPEAAQQPQDTTQPIPTSTAPAASMSGPPLEDEADDNLDPLSCMCPHGPNGERCGTKLTEEQLSSSVQNIGDGRCSPCYPGQNFELDQHKHMEKLGLKKWEHYTPIDAHNRRLDYETRKRNQTAQQGQ